MPSSVKSMGRREDPLQQFETGRIKHLQEERMHIQKKTFTKWMNSFLVKARLEVKDLFTDLADGKMLLRLLEIISGEKLGKPNNGRMRVHKVENVNKSLAFLHTKVRLESIGAEDIVDGNPRLILGLIWTIILRFQIQEIEIKLDEENESSEKRSAKDALLLWCQRKTAGYKGVAIHDFSGSWRSGLGFNALIHAHRPDLIEYSRLRPDAHIENLNNAFTVAHDSLGVARILDAEDIDMNKPDEKSIITYVASYYHTFARMRDEMKGSRRIANIVKQMKGVDDSKDQYDVIITSLLEWIRRKILELDDRDFPNTMDGIQKLLILFGKYRTEEKPPKYIERSEIEALIFSINAQLKELNQPSFCPKDGHNLHDLQKAWQNLEKAEHSREVALREELLRQERLQQLAYKFERKSVLRRGYLDEMVLVLSDPRYGSSLTQVHATVKKHEAISADILARVTSWAEANQERFDDLTKMADELDSECYHDRASIREKERTILQQWQDLLDLLHRHKANLTLCSELMSLMREVETVRDTVGEMEANFRSPDCGAHLLGVEDLLQKHSLMESQVYSCGDTIMRLRAQAKKSFPEEMKESDLLYGPLHDLDTAYKGVAELAKHRRARLEEARNLYQFLADTEEEEAWVVEKQRICKTAVTAKDLRAVMSLLQKHKTLEDEIRARRPKAQRIEQCGRDLVSQQHPDRKVIGEHVDALAKSWQDLDGMVAERRKQLQDAVEAYSFYADANEAESWIKEKSPLVESNDYGEDEPSGRALLQRHARLEEEVQAYQGDMTALQQQGEKLRQAGITVLSLNAQQGQQQQDFPEPAQEDEFEWVEETQLVPEEVVEEVPHEYIQEKYVTQMKLMPTVKAKYEFNGQGMKMAKGEEMFLLAKTNADWWNVRKVTGEEGFIPANYVREGEPREVQMKVKQLEKKQEVRREVKKVLTKKVVSVKKRKPRAPPRSKQRVPEEASETVEQRLSAIAASYARLLGAAQRRRLLLLDAIALFAFYSECSGFDVWMRDKEKMLKEDEGASEGVEAAKRKFEKFLTDLSVASKRIENIDAMVDEFSKNGHSQLSKIKARQKQIHDHWAHLQRLKQQKERGLEGASSVELFSRTCQETKDWMVEKMAKMDTDELGRDLKTIQSLQRKHDQLERELAPVEEKVNHVRMLGSSVKASYPSERGMVDTQVAEVDTIWQQVKDSAGDRRNRLQEAVGRQIFFNSAKALLMWVGGVKAALNQHDSATDVTTAELLLKQHQDLEDDIRAHEDEFREIRHLGEKLGGQGEVGEMLDELNEEQNAIQRGWQQKEDWLRQCLDLQLFNREADQIDVATSGHEAFLDYADVGSTLDGVEALLKRHGELESTLQAQNERLAAFTDTADKLIKANHYDADNINERRAQVLRRRDLVKDKADERRLLFQSSLAFQQFRSDAEDFAKWMADKQKLADDESYRDLNNLERKLQKHEAFQRELHSNEGQLRVLNKTGQDLIARGHYRKKDIADALEELNKAWKKVCEDTAERGRKLRQANDQHNYNKDLEEAGKTLDSLEAALNNADVGSDLRSCKVLINKQVNIDNDLNNMEKKINDMHSTGQGMANDKHFDAENILRCCDKLKDRFQQLKAPASSRRAALDESLKFHQFWFQVDAEQQWIYEHMPLATSQVVGQDLHEAQKLQKKHRKLEAELSGHQPMIDKTVLQGAEYVKERHPQAEKISSLCSELSSNWQELCQFASKRQHLLELSLKAQQYFFEVNEIESWMVEKRNLLTTTDYGRDEDIARKLLAKHKAIELEIDSYSGLVKEMGTTADGLVRTGHPQSKLIKERQQLVNHELKDLQKLSAGLRTKLMESMYRHEYMREAEQLETWVQEQMLTATSQDYGQDYEHLLLLQGKFLDFKHRVEAGYERFNQCEQLAKKLVANESPYTADIETNQEHLSSPLRDSGTNSGGVDAAREGRGGEKPSVEVARYHKRVRAAWNALLDAIAGRDEKLDAAAEIHRFNRDVSDALSRIQEKNKMISDDVGRDVQSVQALLRRHEGYENDLVALEAQLQVLVDDCSRLQRDYPGPNSGTLAAQQTQVLQEWDALQDRAAARKINLQHSARLQAFLAQSRDLLSWSCDLRSSMKAQEKVRDAASAQLLKTDHDRLKLEIEAREDVFSAVVEDGHAMVEEGHYATAEVKDRVEKVLIERGQLHAAWQHKKVYLDQLIDLQFFLRDAKHLDACSSAQEAALAIADTPTTIHQVQTMKKKHDAFEKLVEAQDEKLDSLRMHGAKLVEQNHFHSPNINSRIQEVALRRAKVKKATQDYKHLLEDAFLYAQFIRDVNDANTWISEKTGHLEAQRQKGDVNSLQDKVKRLQKHQAFMAELQAHEPMMKEITEKGETILQQGHPSSAEVRQQVDELVDRWTSLDIAAENHSRGLEEAQDILSFNTQVEKVDSWIRDKMLLVQAHDLGRDHEHCTALMRKLDDVDSDMRVDDTRFVSINRLADKIIAAAQSQGDSTVVMLRRDELNHKWSALKGALDQYRQDLEGALEVHAFNRDATDTTERIVEKAALLSTEETGRDLPQVEGLKRKQENILRDMSAIEKKIRDHEGEARRLSRKYPGQSDQVSGKLGEVQQAWETLCGTSTSRDVALSAAYTLHKFQSELCELQKWGDSLVSSLAAAPLPANVTEASTLLQAHQEKKAEIEGRRDAFTALRLYGERLITEQHTAADTIEQDLRELQRVQERVLSEWQSRQNLLMEANQLQVYLGLASLATDWLDEQQAFLNNYDLGDSLGTVETLMRKHVSFENSFEAQGSKVDQLEKLGKNLVEANHYDSEGVQDKMAEIIGRRDDLLKRSRERSEKLAQSKALQQFLRNVYEVEGWIGEKLQVACDESYLDSSNLQSKNQKHQAFESEMQANSSRLGVVLQEGADLLASKHYAEQDIQTRLDHLESLWQQLLDSSALKRERLHQAYQALLYSRTLDDLDGWMDEVEAALQSEDHGKDLSSVHALLNRHHRLTQDVTGHRVEVDQCQEVAKSFATDDHFMKDDILERTTALVKRYECLQEPLQIRQENLSASLLLQELLRDMDEELLWLHEKTPLADSHELGDSLAAVQTCLKKHQALEVEVTSHDPVVASICSRAQQMIRSNHFASDDIASRSEHLNKAMRQLKDAASVRRLRLLDAQEVQQFYSEVSEAEGFLREKRPLVLSQDYGRDEDSIQILVKKLDTLTRDVKTFQATVTRLDAAAEKLIGKNHFDSDNVEKAMASLRRCHNEVEMLCEQRSRRLQQSAQLYSFMRRAERLLEHLSEQMTVAASEDYGRDVEHIELLIQKFESFLTSLATNEHKVADIRTEADKLLEDKHPEPDKIKDKLEEVEQLWEDLRELSSARQEALTGAKQVHVFDRDADETIRWIIEKDAVISSDDYGLDLETIQALARKHSGFERDLAAVKEKVETVVDEAKRLADLFPDAREHISVKHSETVEVWNALLEKSALRKDKLFQREKLQSYFGDHADLLAWIIEIRAKVTAPELPKDVPSSEAIISRHDEYKVEMDSRADLVEKFCNDGNALIDQGHFMSEEIADKIVILQDNWSLLLHCWTRRDEIYQRNLDVRTFLRDAATIEAWIETSEGIVKDEDLGKSIEEVEELIRRHNDFIKTVEAQEDKLNPVRRITKIESDFATLKLQEETARREEVSRREVERVEARKRKEVHRITEERRKEDERRRTQEIKFSKEDMEAVRLKLNGDYSDGVGDGLEDDQNSGSSVTSYTSDSSRRGSNPLHFQRRAFSSDRHRHDLQEPSLLQRSGSYTSQSSLKRGTSMRSDLFKTTLTMSAGNKGMSATDLKRAESMKLDSAAAAKKVATTTKRTPNFTTRRRTHSFRKHKLKAGQDQLDNMPPVELRGYLERKQELQSGGKKATMRSWKFFYTVLCGQLMCFFKDEEDFCEQKAASPPINILQANVRPATDYTKKKHVLRLITRDNAEYLMSAETDSRMQEWVNKIAFHATLPPSMQLLSYDIHKDVSMPGNTTTTATLFIGTGSPTDGHTSPLASSTTHVPRQSVTSISNTSRDSEHNSSGRSTPVMSHPDSVGSGSSGGGVGTGRLDPSMPHSQSLDNPLYANLEQPEGSASSKPPVPPRQPSQQPNNSTAAVPDDGPIYQNRISVVPSYEVTAAAPSLHTSSTNSYPQQQQQQQQWSSRHSYPANGVRRNSTDNVTAAGTDDRPALPLTGPPSAVGGINRAVPPTAASRTRFPFTQQLPQEQQQQQRQQLWGGSTQLPEYGVLRFPHLPQHRLPSPPVSPQHHYVNQFHHQSPPVSPVKTQQQHHYQNVQQHRQHKQQQQQQHSPQYQQLQQQQQHYRATSSMSGSVGGVDGSNHHHQQQQAHITQVTRASQHHYKGSFDGVDGIAGSRQPITILERRSTNTLPASASSSGVQARHSSAEFDAHRRSFEDRRNATDESTDSEQNGDAHGSGGKPDKRNGRSVFRFFNRRRGAQV